MNTEKLYSSTVEDKLCITNAESWVEKGLVYLKLTYRVENLDEVYTMTLNKLRLPIIPNNVAIDSGYEDGFTFDECRNYRHQIRLGSTHMTILSDDRGCDIEYKTIKKKSRKMTVKEIEKALGYSVEIISEKEKK